MPLPKFECVRYPKLEIGYTKTPRHHTHFDPLDLVDFECDGLLIQVQP